MEQIIREEEHIIITGGEKKTKKERRGKKSGLEKRVCGQEGERVEKRVKLNADKFKKVVNNHIIDDTKTNSKNNNNNNNKPVSDSESLTRSPPMCFSLLSSSFSDSSSNSESLLLRKAVSSLSTSCSNLDDEFSLSAQQTSSTIPCHHFLSDEDEEDSLNDEHFRPEEDTRLTSSTRHDPIRTIRSSFCLPPPNNGSIAASLIFESQNSLSNHNSQKLNSSSFLTREHTKKWAHEETLKFFKGLELFGTDFSMISRLFANRTRKMCKNKFRKEEKFNIQEIEIRLQRNRNLRMKRVVERLNNIRANLTQLKLAKTTDERISVLQNVRRSRFNSFNSIDSYDINVVETIESQLNGHALF